MLQRTLTIILAAALLAGGAAAQESDWPRFQQNAMRHGRPAQGPEAPYRARWIWFGAEKVLRNRARSRDGPTT